MTSQTGPAAPAETPAKRMSSHERREQILTAATAVFGARGYVGTTTDDIARASGVSQPYVVRLFGSKEALFLATLQDALDQLMTMFRAGVAGTDDPLERKARMGEGYVELLQVRGLHQILSQAFLLGSHPVIGPVAREGFARIWRLLRDEAGLDPEQGFLFLSSGMLINTMLGLRLTTEYGRDSDLTELLDHCFPSSIDTVLEAAPGVADPW